MSGDVLLAGPIVRRVTGSRVCVWLATSREIDVELRVFDKDENVLARSNPLELRQQRCQLGVGLFVYLLQAPTPDDKELPRDQLLFYALDILQGDRRVAVDFAALGLTYPGHAHPSFFVPERLANLLYGSCRRPHGGEKARVDERAPTTGDALVVGDELVERTFEDPRQRPALLMLVGDQIYGDNVADSILAMIERETPALFAPETLPTTSSGREDRSAIVTATRFTSDAKSNHLLRFGEYAAMYLYALGNAAGWQLDLENEVAARRAALERFHDGLHKVRRLLANIPTYMIFDDHDVTDDWNITGAWRQRVFESLAGKRVVANALAAYWAFQGWGNDPDNFDKEFRIGIERRLCTALGAQPTAPSRYYDRRLWERIRWDYSIPTEPPIFVLDTRTHRQADGPFTPPQLMDRAALDRLQEEWWALKGRLENAPEAQSVAWPIFVAPTPVMGFGRIERFQNFLRWVAGWFHRMFGRGRLLGRVVTGFDIESWSANRRGFSNFLRELRHQLGIERCVFLSGDVHYSFTAKAEFSSEGQKLEVLQCTCSALSNDNHPTVLELVQRSRQGRARYGRRWSRPSSRWSADVQFERVTEKDFLILPRAIGTLELREDGIRHRVWLSADTPIDPWVDSATK
jgi:hypothetical protein